MVKENSYIVIQAFMVNELNLKGNELLVYAIIWGFSQDGESEFTGSLNYLAYWCNCSRQTIIATLQSLLEKKLIMKNVEYKNNIRFCTYSVVKKTDRLSKNLTGGSQNSLQGWSKNLTGGSQNSLPNNINNNIYNNLNDNIGVTTTDRPEKIKKRSVFQKPSVEEIADYCQERKNGIDPAHFFDYYESKGWIVGKVKMKDWRSAVRNWERIDKERNAQRNAQEKRRTEGHTDADYIRDFDGLDEF